MGDPLGQRQCFAAEGKALLGIPEEPVDQRAQVACTCTRVVPAIELMMKTVPLCIIEPAPRLTVFTCGRRFAEEQTSSPGAVVRLQTQLVIRAVRGKLL